MLWKSKAVISFTVMFRFYYDINVVKGILKLWYFEFCKFFFFYRLVNLHSEFVHAQISNSYDLINKSKKFIKEIQSFKGIKKCVSLCI